MIRNILVANPLAGKLKDVERALDERTNLLPEYMRVQIRMGRTSLSTKEFLEMDVISAQKADEKNEESFSDEKKYFPVISPEKNGFPNKKRK